MTPMSETQPTPGQVIGEDDVAKLRAGDALRIDTGQAAHTFVRAKESRRLIETVCKGRHGFYAPFRFTFIGRPGPDGFIPWTGGACPVPPGTMVAVRTRYMEDGDGREGRAATFCWQWFGDNSDYEDDIIAFRLSPPAGSPPSSKTEHVAGDAVSGAVEAILRQAVEPEEYAKSAHRFFEAADPHGDRERAVKAIVALFAAEIADLKARNKAPDRAEAAEQALADMKADRALDRDGLVDLANDFERRADACHDLNKSDRAWADRMRLHGKEAAYRHAMLLARARLSNPGAKDV